MTKREIKTEWDLSLRKYEKSSLHKLELVRMLRRGVFPDSQDALNMLADILEDDGQALQGGRPAKMVDFGGGHVEARYSLPQVVNELVIVYGLKKQRAKEIVCQCFDVSMRSLEEWSRELLEMHAENEQERAASQDAYEERIRKAWKDANAASQEEADSTSGKDTQ